MKEELLKVVVEAIDLKKIAYVLIDDIVEKGLRKVVESTENSFDDIAFAAVWPELEKQVKVLVEEKLDLGKILGNEE